MVNMTLKFLSGCTLVLDPKRPAGSVWDLHHLMYAEAKLRNVSKVVKRIFNSALNLRESQHWGDMKTVNQNLNYFLDILLLLDSAE